MTLQKYGVHSCSTAQPPSYPFHYLTNALIYKHGLSWPSINPNREHYKTYWRKRRICQQDLLTLASCKLSVSTPLFMLATSPSCVIRLHFLRGNPSVPAVAASAAKMCRWCLNIHRRMSWVLAPWFVVEETSNRTCICQHKRGEGGKVSVLEFVLGDICRKQTVCVCVCVCVCACVCPCTSAHACVQFLYTFQLISRPRMEESRSSYNFHQIRSY